MTTKEDIIYNKKLDKWKKKVHILSGMIILYSTILSLFFFLLSLIGNIIVGAYLMIENKKDKKEVRIDG